MNEEKQKGLNPIMSKRITQVEVIIFSSLLNGTKVLYIIVFVCLFFNNFVYTFMINGQN